MIPQSNGLKPQEKTVLSATVMVTAVRFGNAEEEVSLYREIQSVFQSVFRTGWKAWHNACVF